MRKKLLVVATVLALLGTIVSPMLVEASITGTVTCTVSGQLVSVTVSDGSVSYGTLALSATKNTLLYNGSTNANGMTPADTQTATNNGTVAQDFNISSSSATGTSQSWTLAGSSDVAQFAHQFSIDGGTNWTSLTSEYQTLATNISASGTRTFDLRIIMPSSTTDYGSHSITVTIQAVAH